MFYSHEVLTDRRYGVATVWLVATLGSKSTLKKVSRKAILDVDIEKACETIVEPTAPMALRLQSNLLYGVTRVYAQQCGYVLSDAEATKNHMRLMFKVLKAGSLDAEGGNQARADQLVLQDDPNFYPDFDLVPLDLDRMDLAITTSGGSQGSTLSPHNSQMPGVGIASPEDIGGLIIPGSASSFVGGPVAGIDGYRVQVNVEPGTRVEREGFLDDDLGLMIDDDGNLQMTDAPVRRPSATFPRGDASNMGAASSRAAAGDVGDQQQDILGVPDDDGFMPLQDDDYMLAPYDQEMFGAVQAPAVEQQVTSEDTVAPVRRRRPANPKIIGFDNVMELRNGDLARWNAQYVINMTEEIRHKDTNKAAALAKKNAEFWMLGQHDNGPLSIFSGAKLLEALTGFKLGRAGEKRPLEDEDASDSDRRVRPRGEPSSDEVGRGFDDDGYMPMMDDTIEQGREAPTPLDDRHVSSMMPWNQSAGSQRQTGLFGGQHMPTSASIGGVGGQQGLISRRGSRLTSASPLIGRGAVGGDIDEFQLPGSGIEGLDEFELFGPAAEVDTQTAGMSQWQRSALDGESIHFLEFVQTGIQQKGETRDDVGSDEEDTQETIDFEALLPPETHSRIVAAQGLLHVLALGTKNLLKVKQQEAFGPVTLSTKSL